MRTLAAVDVAGALTEERDGQACAVVVDLDVVDAVERRARRGAAGAAGRGRQCELDGASRPPPLNDVGPRARRSAGRRTRTSTRSVGVLARDLEALDLDQVAEPPLERGLHA